MPCNGGLLHSNTHKNKATLNSMHENKGKYFLRNPLKADKNIAAIFLKVQ